LSESQVEEVRAGLRNIQQEAEIIATVHGNVELDYILERED
jgi:G3E family GTPase